MENIGPLHRHGGQQTPNDWRVGRVALLLIGLSCLQLAVAPGACARQATAQNVDSIVQVDALESAGLHVHTIKELKLMRAFRRTWHQRFDFSCGSAALATLLTYQYDQPTDEMSIFKAMFEIGDQAQIRAKGFSMLDMKRYLEQRGYIADGVQAPLDTLAAVAIPAIALVSDHGYRHFVVVKGVESNHVVIGDPALGTRIMARQDFERAHVGNLFLVIRSHRERAHFNTLADWNYTLKAPIASGVDRNSIALELLTVPNASLF
jgi:predicted double-glycine peptidase